MVDSSFVYKFNVDEILRDFKGMNHIVFHRIFVIGDMVNPNDPNVIAENELLGAAASIEAAARKLAELKPRARPKVLHYSFTQSRYEKIHLDIYHKQT